MIGVDAVGNAINAGAKDWAHGTSLELLNAIRELNIVDSGKLFRSLKYKLKYDFGVAERIGYGFQRYGVFVAKGVGRGRPVGSAKAKKYARDWFNPILDDRLPGLAGKLSETVADTTVRSIKIN